MLENGIELLSWLPPGEENLFIGIKALIAQRVLKGLPIYDLSIGQPRGPAPLPARKAAADAIMSENEDVHKYQDNDSPGVDIFFEGEDSFAKRFVNCHTQVDIGKVPGLGFLPIPGIKPTLKLILMACGAPKRDVPVITTPGYPTPAYWSNIFGLTHKVATLNPENGFLVDPDELKEGMKLVMFNYPHNPSAQISTREYWTAICEKAQALGIRVFNDAAYAILSYMSDYCTLADVAINFPGLSWAEAYSISKAWNMTGWRAGAIVGSKNFIDDIARVKGEDDSGFVAATATGAIDLFENHMPLILEARDMYRRRSELLRKTLTDLGMQLAVEPKAGFFTYWKLPKVAFGQPVKNARGFNLRMLEKTGIAGVPFHPFYRMAVCDDVEAIIDGLKEGFTEAAVEY